MSRPVRPSGSPGPWGQLTTSPSRSRGAKSKDELGTTRPAPVGCTDIVSAADISETRAQSVRGRRARRQGSPAGGRQPRGTPRASHPLGESRRKRGSPGAFGRSPPEIGRAHVCTPVTNAYIVFRLLLEKQNNTQHTY